MSRWYPVSLRPPVDDRGRSPQLWLHYAPGDRPPVKGTYTYFGEDYTGVEVGFSQDSNGAYQDDDGEYLETTGEPYLPTHWALVLDGEVEAPLPPETVGQTFTSLCKDGAPHDYRKHIYGPVDGSIAGHYHKCARCGAIWDMCA